MLTDDDDSQIGEELAEKSFCGDVHVENENNIVKNLRKKVGNPKQKQSVSEDWWKEKQ